MRPWRRARWCSRRSRSSQPTSGYALGQRRLREHAPHDQTLGAHRRAFADDARAEFPRELPSPVGDAGTEASHPAPCPDAMATALQAAAGRGGLAAGTRLPGRRPGGWSSAGTAWPAPDAGTVASHGGGCRGRRHDPHSQIRHGRAVPDLAVGEPARYGAGRGCSCRRSCPQAASIPAPSCRRTVQGMPAPRSRPRKRACASGVLG